jgi:alkylation response protein AidB-like acyl-CoA dehydrogenase
LVCAMHPAVLNFWMATAQAPSPFRKTWNDQRRTIFKNVCEGAWWGTIASEPGTSGDIAKTGATARRGPSDGAYLLTGQKNFGSGSGVTSYMITVAVPEGEAAPDMFVLDMRDVPWDGSAGVTLTAAWDGHGMAATQSHAMAFNEFPVTRLAWPGHLGLIQEATGALTQCVFTAVIVGVVGAALETARQQVTCRRDTLRAYERVEWSKAELEGWLIQQAYEGCCEPWSRTATDDCAQCRQRRRSRSWRSRSCAGSAGYWRRDVLPILALWVLVRGCASARLFASPVGTGLRPAL